MAEPEIRISDSDIRRVETAVATARRNNETFVVGIERANFVAERLTGLIQNVRDNVDRLAEFFGRRVTEEDRRTLRQATDVAQGAAAGARVGAQILALTGDPRLAAAAALLASTAGVALAAQFEAQRRALAATQQQVLNQQFALDQRIKALQTTESQREAALQAMLRRVRRIR